MNLRGGLRAAFFLSDGSGASRAAFQPHVREEFGYNSYMGILSYPSSRLAGWR